MKNIISMISLLVSILFNVSCNSSSYDKDKYELLWSRQVGNYGGYTYGLAVANDYNDNIYITGTTNVGIFDQEHQGRFDFFIVKYDKYGNKLWVNELGKTFGVIHSRAIVTDKRGNVYASGFTNVNVFSESKIGFDDYFIIKYDSNGNRIWSKQVGSANDSAYSFGLTIDNKENLYISGNTTGGLSGESQNGFVDYFVAKYDESGNIIWSKQVGKYHESTYGQGITVDNKGSVYLTGYTTTALSDGVEYGKYDYFLAKYDESGNMIWTKQVGSESGEAKGVAVRADNKGNIYVIGYTTTAISGGMQHGRYDYFLAKYDELGNMKWTKQIGGTNGDTLGLFVTTDINNNVYITGRTTVSLFDVKQIGLIDCFIAKYNESGDLIFGLQFGNSRGKVMGQGMVVGNEGGFYVTGYTDVALFGQQQLGGVDYLITKWK